MIKVNGRKVYSVQSKVKNADGQEGCTAILFGEKEWHWYPYDSVSWESPEF